MRWAVPLICVFAVCFGPFDNAGDATGFVFVQNSFVNKYSNVVCDSSGCSAILKLQGVGNDNNCTAKYFGTAPFCPGGSPTVNVDGSVTRRR